jgi:hypothetical protein
MSVYDGKPYTLVGQNGNVFNLLGYTEKALRECHQQHRWEEIHRIATSGDYDHAVATLTMVLDDLNEENDLEEPDCNGCDGLCEDGSCGYGDCIYGDDDEDD